MYHLNSEMKKTQRDLGSSDVNLGTCINADSNRIGQDIFKNVTVKEDEKNSTSCDFKQVSYQTF